jgi:hypothetical protein
MWTQSRAEAGSASAPHRAGNKREGEKGEKRSKREAIEGEARRARQKPEEISRYPARGGVVCDICRTGAGYRRGPKREPERRGQKGPPGEAIGPEGGRAGETRRERPSLRSSAQGT